MNPVLGSLPEAFVSNTAISRVVSRAVAAGTVRKLASRLYTKNLDDAPEVVVRRNLWGIVAGFFPGALVADRTALEARPAADGSVCVVSDRGRITELPGIVLRPRRGAGPLPSDMPFVDGLFLSSRVRAFLENMRPSRARGERVPRTLTRSEIEERLDGLIRTAGEAAANRLRDDARTLAPALGMEAEAARLDALVGTLARARSRGRPYDPARMALFQTLYEALRRRPPRTRRAPERDARGQATLAFFEAYFSNFVEGTEFLVDEAVEIVFEGRIPQHRLLRERHRRIMGGRPGLHPGEFKVDPNRAGLTEFVAPDLVPGTLEQGFSLYPSLESSFERATYMMFLVSEVHPFADGNGRLARVMMNVELVAAGEERIIIPTVFRNNYIAALRALSRTGRPGPLIQVLDYAQRWTRAVDWSSVAETQRELDECNAFLDSDDAEAEGRRLRMPD